MTTEEKQIRIHKWYLDGIDTFNKWLKSKDKITWDAFLCCSACIVEYDRNHKNPMTQALQKIAWHVGYLKNEVSLEELENSGYFDEEKLQYYKKICGALA